MSQLKLTLSILLFGIIFGFSQNDISSYKYVIVAKQYEFQKSENSYDINRLSHFLFKKNGFITLFNNDQFPDDLAKNPCLALKAVLIKNSSFFKTKIQIHLNDCHKKTIFSSKEGVSREKIFKTSYHEAIRDAFSSIKGLKYSYQENAPKKSITPKIELPKSKNNDKKIIKNVIPKKIDISTYKQGLKTYELHKNNSGFDLFKKNNADKNMLVLKLLQSKIPNVYYAYSINDTKISLENIAYFNENNDLILDELNNSNKIVKITSIIFRLVN